MAESCKSMSPAKLKPVATSDPKPVDLRALANLKHGLTGARLYFQTKEDAAAYDELKTALLEELAPETNIMRDLALQLVTDRYRLISAAEMESKIYHLAQFQNHGEPAHKVQPETWLQNSEKIARIELYASRIQRRYEKNFALYRQLQAERNAAFDAAVQEAAQLAELAESEGAAPAGSAPPAAALAEPFINRDFEFSAPEIVQLVSSYRRLQRAKAVAAAKNSPAPPLRKMA